eukprot:TRINITY_DN34074_c0_g1_i1.p1 TRINITY_DN34074_c0_g1~~TRINITY_DN34074_c0_g1_i1.p1  ORF type:complete len:497 (-),score=89.55 TRINITY_DN34074_c0_g1_i1:118-1608(-)
MARVPWLPCVLGFVVTSGANVCSQDMFDPVGSAIPQGQQNPGEGGQQCIQHSFMQHSTQRSWPRNGIEDVEEDPPGPHPEATRQGEAGASMPGGVPLMEIPRQTTELVATPAPTPPPNASFVSIHRRAKLALLRLSSLGGKETELMGIMVLLVGILVCTLVSAAGAFVLSDHQHHSSTRQSTAQAFANHSFVDKSPSVDHILSPAASPEMPMAHRSHRNRSESSATSLQNDQSNEFQKMQSTRSSIAAVEERMRAGSRASVRFEQNTGYSSRRSSRGGMQDAPVSNDAVLCAGLVVPEDNECVLAIRALPSGSSGPSSAGPLDIMDIQGKPVLKAQINTRASTFRPNASVSSQVPLVTLQTLAPGDGPSDPNEINVLGRCRLGEGVSGKRSMYFYSGTDELFGFISLDLSSSTKGQNRYIFRNSASGGEIAFEGNYFMRQMVVVDRFRAVLADIEPWTMVFEPAKPYCKVRITSQVDVGLVLCGLLAIERLELEDP